ncbi:MAG: hypothetical protein ABJ360_17615, partial [Roseobacter sp.]
LLKSFGEGPSLADTKHTASAPIKFQSIKYQQADLRCTTPQWLRCGQSSLMRVQQISRRLVH